MDNPNTIANTSTGTTTQIASVGPSSPNSFPAYPSWNTSTVSSNDALTDRQFNRTALSGTSSERNAMNSMIAAVASWSPTVLGKQRNSSGCVSDLVVVKAPSTTAADPRARRLRTSARSLLDD